MTVFVYVGSCFAKNNEPVLGLRDSRHLQGWREARPAATAVIFEMPAELVNAFGRELRRGADQAVASVQFELLESRAEVKELAGTGEALEAGHAWLGGQHKPQGQLLGQRGNGTFLLESEDAAGLAKGLCQSPGGHKRYC